LVCNVKVKTRAKKDQFLDINGSGGARFTGINNVIKGAGLVNSQMLDGFVKGPAKKPAQSAAQHTRPHLKSSQVHTRTEKGHTLMRGGLKKPSTKITASFNRFSGNNIEREVRAKSTHKHPGIDRFGTPRPPAKKTPAKPLTGEVVNSGGKAAASRATAPLPSMVTSASHHKLERLLDQALTHADSHKEAMRYGAARHFWQRGSRRWVILAVILVAIVVGLFISWQKVPQLSVKTAGMQAHLSPTVPTYKPDDFKMAGPAKAVSGTVDIKYVSSDNSQSYNIVQAQSNLTSQMVGQNVVPKGSTVQTSQVEGNTVYIYGENNDAAWVNNGILYTIKDGAHLNSDELIKIVQGLNP
jgi:hypothetical protein